MVERGNNVVGDGERITRQHHSALHPLQCCLYGYLGYDHEVNLRWGAPMMLTSFSGIGTSRSRSHQDPSVAHDRDGAVDLHHPQQHYYTMAAVLIRRGFPSLSRARGGEFCARILPIAPIPLLIFFF